MTCAFYNFNITSQPNPKNPLLLNHSDVSKVDFVVTPSVNLADPRVKCCKVVLEDISSLCAAEKLKTLNQTQDNPHKSDSRDTKDRNYLQGLQAKTPIAWGKMDDKRWSDLDTAVNNKLHKGQSLSERIELLQNTIYEEGIRIFGHSTPKLPRNLSGKSRRTIRSIHLIKTKNSLLVQISSLTDPIQKGALEQLLVQVRSKIRSFRSAERSRKKRWKFKRAQLAFQANPYKAGKVLFVDTSDVKLCIGGPALDLHKQAILTDPFYDIPLSDLEGLPPSPDVPKAFPSTSLKYEDFDHVLYTRRNASAPGPNGIPYKVYKKCPQISAFLFNVFKCCLKNCVVPIQWRHAKEIYIPKNKTPSANNIKDFRPVALLNVEGKVFFSLISRRLEAHIISNNKFVNTSIQKGCMDKVPGCWEHMSMVWSALKEARLNKKDLSTVWLDIANAYGSIPHKLIFFALERYGVPSSWISLIKKYYVGIHSKSFSKSAPSNWHQHQRGIFAGCTLSIILFLAGINIILEYTLNTSVSNFISSTEVSMPLVRAFMDDLNLMSSSVSGTQKLLTRCTTALSWAGMEFRADKSRSFVLIKGKSLHTTPFSVAEPDNPADFSKYIPSIHSMPIKFLGRVVDGSISDRKSIDELNKKLNDGLDIIDKSPFKGPQKLWILQHLLIPRIQWPLLIYEVSMSTATRLEQKISSFMRKWLHLHRSTTNLCLYSSSSPCPLPVKSLTSVLKSSKISGHLLLRDSKDPLVSAVKPALYSGSWKASDAIDSAEAELRFKNIRGPPQFGRAGLGMSSHKTVPVEKHCHDYRKLISDTAKEIDADSEMCRAIQMQVQCQWTRWENYIKSDLTWKCILAMPPDLLSFCLSSTFDVLPSPSNLKRWRICTESCCFLCGKDICTTSHVLGACKTSLSQGRYTFRHDAVLKELVQSLKVFLADLPTAAASGINKISFVKAGKGVPKTKKKPSGILHLANDWVVLADLKDDYIFPGHIAVSALRPDIVLYSNSLKRVIIIELTCPCEENMEAWHSTKQTKYSPLINIIFGNGWFVDFFAVEVGARGYCSRSVTTCLKRLGFDNKLAFSSAKNLGQTSMMSSFYIWLARNSRSWEPIPQIPVSKPAKENNHQIPVGNVSEGTKQSKKVHKPAATNNSNKSKTDENTTTKVPHKNHHAGLINKGNTCYANAILQAFSVVPLLWSQRLSESSQLSPLLKSISLNMSLLKRSASPVDPSNFLRALVRTYSLTRSTRFNCNSQQDVPEVLRVILDELKGTSTLAADIFCTTIRTTVTCDVCFTSSVTEDKREMLILPPKKHISSSIEQLLQAESLSGGNRWFCPLCSSFQNSCRETSIVSCGSVLILQLLRYSNTNNNIVKDISFVNCLPSENHFLSIPIQTTDSVSFSNEYSLVATINHSGTLHAGHYWAFIKDIVSNTWSKCNDRSVLKVNYPALNNNTSYVFFYVRK